MAKERAKERRTREAFDEKLAALEKLRRGPAEEAEPALLKALRDRNNYYASRAAAILAERGVERAIPELLAAYERSFEGDPVKTDARCFAKTAIAAALASLGVRDPEVYIRGINYEQLEPSFGPPVDSAATLRATCAIALIDCPMPALTILRHLAPLLVDSQLPVRVDTVRAITHLGDPAGAPLLRLKALTGDKEPEVLGQCFAGLLALEPGTDAVRFIENFVEQPDPDVQLEAACALAQSREPAAFDAVKRYWSSPFASRQIREAILLNLGASPLKDAAAFLRAVIEESPDLAPTARRALEASRHSE